MKVNLNEIVTVDFETYFDSKYSLRSKAYNTSSYIRDSQYKTQCVAIKVGKKPTKVYNAKDATKALKAIDWSKHDLLCHHVHFDGAILGWHYGVYPRRYFCTLSQSRALHADYSSKGLDAIAKVYGLEGKLGGGEALSAVKGIRELTPELYEPLAAYCAEDNEMTFKVFERQIEVMPEEEIELIDLTARMFIQPVFLLDEERCQVALDAAIKERQTGIALALTAAKLKTEKDLTSNVKFAAALRKLGVEPPTKVSKYNGATTYAFSETDEEFVELLNHEDREVVLLVDGRLKAKSTINETRAARLLQAGYQRLPIPVYLNYYGAKTGRWSGGNKLNFQNFPRGGELRRSIIAPDGHVIVVADSGQIEARMLAWFAGEQSVLDLFAAKQDVYKWMAGIIYGKDIKDITDDERFVGKVAILGLGYGMGARKFQTTMALGIMGPPVELPLALCTKIVKMYRATNKKIEALWAQANKILAAIARGESGEWGCCTYDADGIWLPNGMPILYPGLKQTTEVDGNWTKVNFSYFSRGKKTKIYGALMVENVIQALARIVVSTQMLDYNKYLKTLKLKKMERAQVATMSHDEIVSIVPARVAKTAFDANVKLMKIAPEWCKGVPLNAEGGYSVEYSK